MDFEWKLALYIINVYVVSHKHSAILNSNFFPISSISLPNFPSGNLNNAILHSPWCHQSLDIISNRVSYLGGIDATFS